MGLLRDNFAITEYTDPRTRIADDLTAPQFVAAIRAIENEILDKVAAAVERLDVVEYAASPFAFAYSAGLDRTAVLAAIEDIRKEASDDR